MGLSTYTPNSVIITGIANSPATMFNIFGNITPLIYGVNSNTSTGINFTSGLGAGVIIIQMYDPVNYFAMHFQRSTEINRCSGRNNDQFIT